MRPLLFLAFTLAAASAPAALTGPAQSEAPVRPGLSADERARCLAQSGRIGIAGLLGGEICIRPTADAGRSCTDSDQCEGVCELNPTETRPLPRAGTRTAGQCQAETNPFGCRSLIEDGVLQRTLCTD